MYIHKSMHSFVSTHENKRKIFVAFQTAHGERFSVLCTATRLMLAVLADSVNREFKKLLPKDEHSLHSPNSFYSLGYLFISQYIRKPNNSVPQAFACLTRLCICFEDFNCPQAEECGLIEDQSRITTLLSVKSQYITDQEFVFTVLLKRQRKLFYIRMVQQFRKKKSYYRCSFQY